MDELETHVDDLRGTVGDTLRTVAVGNVPAREFELVYMRADTASMYGEEVQAEIFEDAVFETVGAARKQDLFEPLGELETTVRVFEHGINAVAWNEADVVFVGLAPEEDSIPAAVRAVKSMLASL